MCNRIEDLIEKARHYEDLWHEALDDNARLKAEVESLTAEVNYRKNMDTHIKIMADQYTPVKEGKPSV